MSNWSSLKILELRRIANFVYDQRVKLKEEDRKRKEAGRKGKGKGEEKES